VKRLATAFAILAMGLPAGVSLQILQSSAVDARGGGGHGGGGHAGNGSGGLGDGSAGGVTGGGASGGSGGGWDGVAGKHHGFANMGRPSDCNARAWPGDAPRRGCVPTRLHHVDMRIMAVKAMAPCPGCGRSTRTSGSASSTCSTCRHGAAGAMDEDGCAVDGRRATAVC
jgi:hypothetical protein